MNLFCQLGPQRSIFSSELLYHFVAFLDVFFLRSNQFNELLVLRGETEVSILHLGQFNICFMEILLSLLRPFSGLSLEILYLLCLLIDEGELILLVVKL